ncbi:MAG: YlmC/YmxH family sporulation protein [Clostridia bacterium]|nr:YlmC/YmxH family sporulation protein [Clostridia bacterium]
MNVRITDLCEKQVINVCDGGCLGFVNDVEVDTVTAKIIAIVVYGQPKIMGLLGRQDDTVIPWCCIKVIGDDTVLVEMDAKSKLGQNGKSFVGKLFEE